MTTYLTNSTGEGSTFISDNIGFAVGTVYSIGDGIVTTFDFDADDDGRSDHGEDITYVDGSVVLTNESLTYDVVLISADVTFSDGTTTSYGTIFRAMLLENGQALWQVVSPTGDLLTKDIKEIEITSASYGGSGYGAYPGSYGFDMVVCFAAGSLIRAEGGDISVEKLKVGDLVETMDHGMQPLRWVGCKELGYETIMRQPELRPIRIAKDALGSGYPFSDLFVSPQHRIFVNSRITKRIFGVSEIIVPAKHLLALEGIDIAPAESGVTYYHILFDQHEIVWANGTPTLSLYLGSEALKSMSEDARREIAALFPEVLKPGFEPLAARQIPQRGKLSKSLANRHHKNGQALLDQSLFNERNGVEASIN